MTEQRPDPAFAERVITTFGEQLAEDRVAGGEVVCSLGFTRAAVADGSPYEWESFAAWAFALLEREPVKSSPAYAYHRIVLGALASEHRDYAAAAGEPVGLQADVRDVRSQREERAVLERLDAQGAAYSAHVDDVIAAGRAQRAVTPPSPPQPEEQPVQTDTPPWIEQSDAFVAS